MTKKNEAGGRRTGMSEHWAGSVKGELGGHESKPPKHISHIVHRKSHNGDHIFEHHHTHPDHHPVELHTKRGDDEMLAHMLAHAGTPNPEGGDDVGTPDAIASAAPTGAPAQMVPNGGSGPLVGA